MKGSTNYDECTKANWESCMGETPFSFEDAKQYTEADMVGIEPVPDISDDEE